MADFRMLIKNHLASFPPLAARFGNRIWPGSNLPHGFNPTDNGGQHALLFMIAAGAPGILPVHNPQVRIECYGLDDLAAGDSAELVFSTIHAKQRAIGAAYCDVGPQTIPDPATGWAIGVTIWTFRVRLFQEALTWQQ